MKFLVVREIQFNDKNQLSESIRMKGADVTVGKVNLKDLKIIINIWKGFSVVAKVATKLSWELKFQFSMNPSNLCFATNRICKKLMLFISNS